jgi:tetratricopeptide (TPR) repeat protein
MVDVANLSGNDQLAQNRLNVLNAFLKEQGYTNKGLDEVTLGNERKVAADIFRQLGDFYLNNQRQYKVAIQYFEKCIRFMMKGGTKGPSRSIVDDANVRNSIFKKSRQSAYVEKPENIDGADLKNIGDMYRFFAMACFNYGLKEWSVELAQRSMNCFRGACGDLNKYLTYPTSSPLRRSDMAMLLFMTGDTEGAIRMADSVETIPPCEFCTYGACYDRILTLARIYEMSGNIPKAVEYYKMAYEKTKDDAEIYVALRTLDGRSSVK